MPNYVGPDYTRNALTLLRTLAEGDGEDEVGFLQPAMVRMAMKNAALGLAAQDEIGKHTRETLLEAIRLAGYFAEKYAASAGRPVMDVIDETAAMFEASIPAEWEPHPPGENN
jgi:hypothetical protein